MAKKYNIPKPPGGTLTCGDNQLGVVHVVNGEVHASCNNITSSGGGSPGRRPSKQSLTALENSISEVLLGEVGIKRSTLLSGRLTYDDPSKIKALREFGLSSDDKVETYFFIPERLKSRLE